MLYRLRKSIAYALFNRACQIVWGTPPIQVRPGVVEIVSMVARRDLLLYVAAVKTFYAQLRYGSITAIDDGSLTAEDRERLKDHIAGINIRSIADIDTGTCPRGGTWERLMYIARACAGSYVVQLDSDTLTVGAIPEVTDCVGRNRSFVIGTEMGQTILSFSEAAQVANHRPGNHIQLCSERLLPQAEMTFRPRYVRGCSGFSGFGVSSVSPDMVQDFSARMTRLLGPRWSEWGTEQVTSNVMVAQSDDACVLPFPKYSGFEGHECNGAAFLHFYGSHRFKGGVYADVLRKVLVGEQAAVQVPA